MDAEAVKAEAIKRLKREQEGEGAPIRRKEVVRFPLCFAGCNHRDLLCAQAACRSYHELITRPGCDSKPSGNLSRRHAVDGRWRARVQQEGWKGP